METINPKFLFTDPRTPAINKPVAGQVWKRSGMSERPAPLDALEGEGGEAGGAAGTLDAPGDERRASGARADDLPAKGGSPSGDGAQLHCRTEEIRRGYPAC